ncbi:SAM-dependent methyltransferase [Nonomuraea sp. NPDC050536]|uniref:SAM-dependent methyltransferase n=1 Tax=Nonomuraea sp. NPDC050536 TaxID=3364366 RepID=UPI0037C6B183
MTFDPTVPNAARVYDCILGGKDHFTADRKLVRELTALLPDLADAVWANRAFLGRAVRYLAGHGVEQFIDIGTGLPTQDNVHEIARRVVPEARVVYVDHDPVVVSHGRALLAREPGLAMVDADACLPEEIVKAPEVVELIDWSKPVGLVLVAVLHFLEDPAAVLYELCSEMVPGSHLVITHACADHLPADTRTAAVTAYNKAINSPIHLRTETQIASLFADLGCALVKPGLVEVSTWRQDEPVPHRPDSTQFLGGIGVIPERTIRRRASLVAEAGVA